MNNLPDEIIELIIDMGTFKCIDCKNTRYYQIKKCIECDLCACKTHLHQRFAFDPCLCNNCLFWKNGLPASAKGSTEW